MTTITATKASELFDTFCTLERKAMSSFFKDLAVSHFVATYTRYASTYGAMEAAFDYARDEESQAEMELMFAHGY